MLFTGASRTKYNRAGEIIMTTRNIIAAMMIMCIATTTFAVELTSEGKTSYRIVVSVEADVSTKAVADDLADLLKQISGADFPVVADDTKPTPYEIVIGGDNSRLSKLELSDMTRNFAQGEYEIRTVGDHLVIAGGPPRGTINGMYGLLMDHLGCRFLTPASSRVPKQSSIKLGDIRDRQKPAFKLRSTSPPMHWDASWTVRNRLNECKTWGGSRSMMVLMSDPRTQTLRNYYSAHALSYIPQSLFDEHPEYYALIDGKRTTHDNSNQRAYCVTNQGFVQYMADRFKRSAAGYHGKPVRIGLGHTDSANRCGCKVCKDSYTSIGLPGTYMQFNNQVAELVCKDYPNVTLGTLAYGMTFAPTSVKMHPNVLVTWCPISADYLYGFDQGGPNRDRDLVGQLRKWLDNTSQLGVWYYHYQADSLMPHPRLFASQHNFAMFEKLGLDGVYVETGGNTIHDNPVPDGDNQMRAYNDPNYGYFTFAWSMTHIKSYIACRLMWDPDYDVAKGIREFCEIYYGPAGDELAEYVLLVEAKYSYAKTIGSTFRSYPGVHMSASFSPMLKWSVVQKMDSLFDQAQKKVAKDPTRLRRVQMARLSVQLAILCFADPDDPLRSKAFNGFFPLIEELGVKHLARTGITYNKITIDEFKKIVANPEKIVIPGQEVVGANLLANTSFETEIDGDGIPDAWSATGKYNPEGYNLLPGGVRLDDSKAHTGKRSVKLVKTPKTNSIVSLRQRFDVTPGSWYRMTVMYQAKVKQGNVNIIFTRFNKDGKELGHTGGNRGVQITGDKWMELSVDTQAPDDTTQLMVEFMFYDDKSHGVAWIDDFTCVKLKK